MVCTSLILKIIPNIILLYFFSFWLVPSEAEIRVGVIVNSEGGWVGRDNDTRNGIFLWKKWNEDRGGIKLGSEYHNISIWSRDGYLKTDETTGNAYQAAIELIEQDNVDILVGPFSTARTGLMLDAILDSNRTIPLMATLSADESIFARNTGLLFGISSPTLNSYPSGIFDMLLARNIKTFAAVYKSTIAFGVNLATMVDEYFKSPKIKEKYPNSKISFFPYDAGHIEDAFYASVSTIKSVKATEPECFVSFGITEDLEVLSTIFAAEGYSPKLAFSFYDAQQKSPDFFNLTRGWLVSAYYDPAIRFGHSGKYMGTTTEYTAFYKQYFGVEDSLVPATASAACILWQKAAELADDQWRNVSALFEKMRTFKPGPDDIFTGEIEINEFGQNIEAKIYTFSVEEGYLRYIRNESEITIPTVFNWTPQNSESVADGDDSTSLIVGLTVGLFFVCLLCMALVVLIVILVLLRHKFHFFMLKRS